MLWKIITILILLSTLGGCRNHKILTGDHPKELVGTWQLLIRSSCNQYGIQSDTLILHPDGTFDQHVMSRDGRGTDATAQHWRYNADGNTEHIALDKRLEFFTPENSNTRKGNGVETFEVLLVESGLEPVIVLHPDSDCVYEKIKGI
jgi:C-terminal lipocalin-like domain